MTFNFTYLPSGKLCVKTRFDNRQVVGYCRTMCSPESCNNIIIVLYRIVSYYKFERFYLYSNTRHEYPLESRVMIDQLYNQYNIQTAINFILCLQIFVQNCSNIICRD